MISEISPRQPIAATPSWPGSQFWRELGYLASGLLSATVAFTVAIAGLSIAVSTVVFWIGVPVLAATLWASRALADAERRATTWATGRTLLANYGARQERSGLRNLLGVVRERQPWRDLLHAVIAFPVQVLTSSLAVSWTVGGLGGLLYVAWHWALPDDDDTGGLYFLLTGSDSQIGEIALNTVLGGLMVATSPAVVHGLVEVRARLAGALLCTTPAGRQPCGYIEGELEHETRPAAMPGSAEDGLGRALSAAVAAARVPTSLAYAVLDGQRFDEETESAAHAVVVKALANVAAHAHARQCVVVVLDDGERLVVQVRDDGRGGAQLVEGRGLAALSDRLGERGGALDIASPLGGPTVLTAEIPLGAIR